MDVNVNYLTPNYYKVIFNTNDHQQIIVKNDDGVFVLTPSLNKEFKFNSEWPINSSHGYLLEQLVSLIKNDKSSSFEVDNDQIIISANIDDLKNSVNNLKFYYDLKNKKPLKVIFFDAEDKESVKIEFTNFIANSKLTVEEFNNKLIMEQNTPITNDEKEEETSIDISCGYVCEGVNLSDYIENEDFTVLCYTGETNYTVVVQKVDVYSNSLCLEEYDDYDFVASGLLLISNNYSRYYVNDYEVSIYSNELSKEDLYSIAQEIIMS